MPSHPRHNTAFRPHLSGARMQEVRHSMLMSQSEFATALREAGKRHSTPVGASKRLVQAWEAEQIHSPGPIYRRLLEEVTGQPFEALCTPPAAADAGEVALRVAEISTRLQAALRDLAALGVYLRNRADPSTP